MKSVVTYAAEPNGSLPATMALRPDWVKCVEHAAKEEDCAVVLTVWAFAGAGERLLEALTFAREKGVDVIFVGDQEVKDVNGA